MQIFTVGALEDGDEDDDNDALLTGATGDESPAVCRDVPEDTDYWANDRCPVLTTGTLPFIAFVCKCVCINAVLFNVVAVCAG